MSKTHEFYACCPLCGQNHRLMGRADASHNPQWHAGLLQEMEWMQCEACSHVYTRHHWTDAGLVELFRHTLAIQQAHADTGHDSLRPLWTPVVERAITHLGGYGPAMKALRPPTWLDVGCGNGALVMVAGDYGFKAQGLDARTDTVAHLRDLGFDATQGDFVQAELPTGLDVLSMMDVLEHMAFPVPALQKAHRVLRPDGLLVISLPDMDSSSWRLMDHTNNNPYWIEIEHHHNFGRARLTALLHAQGFEVIDFTVPQRYKAQLELYARRV